MSLLRFARAALGATALGGGGTLALHIAGFGPPVPFATANADAPQKAKQKLVVLGSGWGAVALLKTIDSSLYDVSVISPRNYFLNTPLLPGVTVGTVEARSLIEPMRRLLPGKPGESEFYEAACVGIDPVTRTVTCRDVSGVTAANPEFRVPYDRLVVAVGAPCNTFGTPGVAENAIFLKEVEDRGLHSSTFRLNLSAFCGIGGAFRNCSGGGKKVFRGYQGVFRVHFVSETAQVELRSGRV
jgi:NADH:ubiquinone reductase (non-electrogenic)